MKLNVDDPGVTYPHPWGKTEVYFRNISLFINRSIFQNLFYIFRNL